MTEKEINRRALEHGRNALRAENAEALVGKGWAEWELAGLYPHHVGLGLSEDGAPALDLACVMYAQMEARR